MNSGKGILAVLATVVIAATGVYAQSQDAPEAAGATPDFGLVGFAAMGDGTTGGAGGKQITVSTASEFVAAVGLPEPAIVQVSGTIDLGSSAVQINSNKSIIGLGADAALHGQLNLHDVSNIIIRNVLIANPRGAVNGDGLQSIGSHHIWVDHCDFSDCTDGQFDITRGSDFITVSWCRFYYTNPRGRHRLSSLIGNRDDLGHLDDGRLHVTLHHNWWGENVQERMPRVRFGRVHIFNNFYGVKGNSSAIGLGISSQVLLESNYFDNVRRPWRNKSRPEVVQGIIQWNDDNVFMDTEVPDWAPNSTVFKPPYKYKLESGSSVKNTVMKYAGVGKGPFAPGI